MRKSILAVAFAAVLAFALAGCTASSSFFGVETNEETGALQVTADNADKDATAITSLTIQEGCLALISPDLKSGSVQVILSDDAGKNTVLDETVSGRVLSTYDVAPGTYKATIVSAEAGTTGTTVIAAPNAKEWEQQDAQLMESLEKLNIDPSIIEAAK